MNSILQYVKPKNGDTRCKMCRHHQYVILSSEESLKIYALHTDVSALATRRFPALRRYLHWWGLKQEKAEEPECLKSYQKIGGSK